MDERSLIMLAQKVLNPAPNPTVQIARAILGNIPATRQIMNPTTQAFNSVINSAHQMLQDKAAQLNAVPQAMAQHQLNDYQTNKSFVMPYVNQIMQGMNESNQPDSRLLGNGATPYALGAYIGGVTDVGPEAKAGEDALSSAAKFGRSLREGADFRQPTEMLAGFDKVMAKIPQKVGDAKAGFYDVGKVVDEIVNHQRRYLSSKEGFPTDQQVATSYNKIKGVLGDDLFRKLTYTEKDHPIETRRDMAIQLDHIKNTLHHASERPDVMQSLGMTKQQALDIKSLFDKTRDVNDLTTFDKATGRVAEQPFSGVKGKK